MQKGEHPVPGMAKIKTWVVFGITGLMSFVEKMRCGLVANLIVI
jgi:hypothetical protein